MDDLICTTDGCERIAAREGLCKPHHYHHRRRTAPKKSCAVEVCERVADGGKGLCKTHYVAQRRKDPTRPRCADESCEAAAVTRALCNKHYLQTPEQLEKHRAASRAWAKRTYADTKERRDAWRLANPERVLRYRREWMRKWREANPDLNAERMQAWVEANPERWNELRKQASSARRARKRGTQVERVDFALILERHGLICHICSGDIEPDELHMDHVIPLAKGGTHTYGNVLPSHARCNMRKSDRLDWAG